jgi:hypothetical protein
MSGSMPKTRSMSLAAFAAGPAFLGVDDDLAVVSRERAQDVVRLSCPSVIDHRLIVPPAPLNRIRQ